MKQILIILSFIVFFFFSNSINLLSEVKNDRPVISPVALTCEYLKDPAIIDKPHPRLSWINIPIDTDQRGCVQRAWQIQVASSKEMLLNGNADLWDSGKCLSEQSTLVKYAGLPLTSNQECWWQVRVWDGEDNPSQWSDIGFWGMGLLQRSDWKAKWIGSPWEGEKAREEIEGHPHVPAPFLRKSFTVKKTILSAKAFVTGLGYFEFYVNGIKVSEDVLSPNHTNYGKREGLAHARVPLEDNFRAYRVLYLGYDITSLLQPGDNMIGCILGNGFYNPIAIWTKAYGSPRFIGQIELTYIDGTKELIVSDETWSAHPSPILVNDVYGGEVYDARKEVQGWSTAASSSDGWIPVVLRSAPEGELSAQMSLPDRVMEKFTPITIEKLEDGSFEVDFGEEISGWVRLHQLQGAAGDTVSIVYLSESPNNGVCKYVMSGGGNESYAPRFTWYVFRKVKVINYPGLLTVDRLTAEAVYSDVKTVGRFNCSNNLFNLINRIWCRSQLDNMHGGVVSDCPHRERSAYTGDGQVACVTVMHNFDVAAFYTKWIRDILDAQDIETGYVPNGAPWQPGCGGGVGWGAAMNIMPWEFYLHYGDREMLERNYDGMKHQLNYMLKWLTPDGTMLAKVPNSKAPIAILNLGEWCVPFEKPLNELVHTFFLWRCADLTAKSAKALNFDSDVRSYSELTKEIKLAFHKRFYDPQKASYGDNGSNLFALKMGVPDSCINKVLETLSNEISNNNGHLNTGIFGTQLFFEVLAENGLNELAYNAMNKCDFPSFGNWIAQGATTTWEQWNGGNSHNHPMFGGGLTWFYRKLAGMEIDENRPGYKHIFLRPMPTDSLSAASYEKITPYGKASVSWMKERHAFYLDASVPIGSTATIFLPCKKDDTILESTNPVLQAEGVSFRGWKAGYASFDVGSGRFRFTVKSKEK